MNTTCLILVTVVTTGCANYAVVAIVSTGCNNQLQSVNAIECT